MHLGRSSESKFRVQVDKSAEGFGSNALLKALEVGQFDMGTYHKLLMMLFHQTFLGPSTFALAGANCASDKWEIRDYFLLHASEERYHWQWIIEDLENTGYKGEDPRGEPPHPATQNYIAFNYFIAYRWPMARLGIAAVLETIGATYAKSGATKICKTLNLNSSQTKFLFGHGDTDVGHAKEIMDLLSRSNLSSEDWAWLEYAAKFSGSLYTKMYEDVVN